MPVSEAIVREVIRIDEELCDGCGLCVPACKERAIQIVDGKAKLVSEVYCDGLGSCLGECPQGAITIEKREAAQFDEKAVDEHLARLKDEQHAEPIGKQPEPQVCGCPGSQSQAFTPPPVAAGDGGNVPSQLRNWPVELMLVPPQAPYYENADLLIAADCVPFAYAGFHQRFLQGKVLIIGCPKLDDAEHYVKKLTQLFTLNSIASITVPFMEVPCCFGLVQIVRLALEASGKSIPASFMRISIRGEEQESFTRNELPF